MRHREVVDEFDELILENDKGCSTSSAVSGSLQEGLSLRSGPLLQLLQPPKHLRTHLCGIPGGLPPVGRQLPEALLGRNKAPRRC